MPVKLNPSSAAFETTSRPEGAKAVTVSVMSHTRERHEPQSPFYSARSIIPMTPLAWMPAYLGR